MNNSKITALTRIGGILLLVMALGACSSGPPPRTADYPEPTYSHERLVPEDLEDPQTQVYDPWEGMNRRIYNFNYHFDQKIFLPVVRGYKWVTPDVVERRITNFFNNIRDIRTLANSILQFSPGKTVQSTGRVVVNSTVGLLGLFDVATSMGMPRPSENFGQTLGRYGVGPGPYLSAGWRAPNR